MSGFPHSPLQGPDPQLFLYSNGYFYLLTSRQLCDDVAIEEWSEN